MRAVQQAGDHPWIIFAVTFQPCCRREAARSEFKSNGSIGSIRGWQMENGQFRHVSAGALLLVAFSLLAAVAGAFSVAASGSGYQVVKTGTGQVMRFQGEFSDRGILYDARQITVAQASGVDEEPENSFFRR